MYKETVTYTDYNDEERTEDFYFNLTETEISEMELMTEGGLKAKLEKIIGSKDRPQIIAFFKEILLKAYGEKTPDGRRFMKQNGELAKAFAETEAYNILFMKYATDADAAADFINGIIPKNIRESKEFKEAQAANISSLH